MPFSSARHRASRARARTLHNGHCTQHVVRSRRIQHLSCNTKLFPAPAARHRDGGATHFQRHTMVNHQVVELQLIVRQVGGVGVVPRIRLRLEGRAVDPHPPQRTAEQPLRVGRQRRAVSAALLRCCSTRAPFALARLQRTDILPGAIGQLAMLVSTTHLQPQQAGFVASAWVLCHGRDACFCRA